MFRQICATAILLTVVSLQVHGAMKKSWKSAANFDTEIPKFTPFESNENLANKKLDEVQMRTTLNPPSAETLPGKMSSKIKAPTKYVADIYKNLHMEIKKNSNQDFGAFNANLAAQAAHEDRFETIVNEQLDIEQVLNQLTDKAEFASDTSDNGVETEDELEITPIANSGNSNTTQYKVGPLMNVTIDSEDSVVNVNLDQNTLKEIFTGSGSRLSFTALECRHKLTKFCFFP